MKLNDISENDSVNMLKHKKITYIFENGQIWQKISNLGLITEVNHG